jgi:hypothetical protein
LLVSSFLPGLPLPLTLEEPHPLKRHVSSYVDGHEPPTGFLPPGDEKSPCSAGHPVKWSPLALATHTQLPANDSQIATCDAVGMVRRSNKRNRGCPTRASNSTWTASPGCLSRRGSVCALANACRCTNLIHPAVKPCLLRQLGYASFHIPLARTLCSAKLICSSASPGRHSRRFVLPT